MRFVGIFLVAAGLIGCPADPIDPNYPPPTSCTTGQTRCSGTVIQTCSAMRVWESGVDCNDTSRTCDASSGTAVCTGGGGGFDCSSCASGTECWFCDSGIVRYCDGPVQGDDYADCNDLLGDGSVPAGWCYDFGGTWGADCVFGAGSACAFVAGSDLVNFACGDASGPISTMGCDIDNGCVSSITACNPSTQADPYCDGSDYLSLGCHSTFSQPLLVDCLDYDSGTCQAFNTSFACVHSTSGGDCIGGVIECDPSTLTCNDTTDVCDPI